LNAGVFPQLLGVLIELLQHMQLYYEHICSSPRQKVTETDRILDKPAGNVIYAVAPPPPSELYYSLINPNLWANSGKLGVNNKSKTNVLVCIITKISLFYQGTKRSTDTQTDIHTDIQTESMTENYKSPTK